MCLNNFRKSQYIIFRIFEIDCTVFAIDELLIFPRAYKYHRQRSVSKYRLDFSNIVNRNNLSPPAQLSLWLCWSSTWIFLQRTTSFRRHNRSRTRYRLPCLCTRSATLSSGTSNRSARRLRSIRSETKKINK